MSASEQTGVLPPPPAPAPDRRLRVGPGRGALLAAGVCLTALGPLTRFYIAPQLIVAPTDIYQTTTLVAAGATYFDQGALKTVRGATLTYTGTVRGAPGSSTGDTAVWDSFSALEDLDRGTRVTLSTQRFAFDRRTGRLSTCCGAALDGDTRVRQEGLGLFWPIGVDRADYPLYDSGTRRAWPARYAGQDTVEGIRTYRFVQHVPPTKVGTVPAMPRSLLGLPAGHGEDAAVPADRYYAADVTIWVDPRTGVTVDRHQKVSTVLHGPGGRGTLVAADMDLRMTPKVRADLADKSRDSALTITLLRTVLPLAASGVGLLLTAAALLRPRRRAQQQAR
ncbi:DUF3068 domain-containing protein [Actinomadura parmotrematis]|uniref:DUF3068 domain-containing protein n=1 Tax=Actinomadura parmotrematis TaxID=2864039 RepID=A0ABS7FUG4_9ACTN|nr:DUF3068 domain-containing protein [Actinomadura parmotrematis]MBW8483600.1 DUF3068 domain-containing protein [Actinomadura parmotrematis]